MLLFTACVMLGYFAVRAGFSLGFRRLPPPRRPTWLNAQFFSWSDQIAAFLAAICVAIFFVYIGYPTGVWLTVVLGVIAVDITIDAAYPWGLRIFVAGVVVPIGIFTIGVVLTATLQWGGAIFIGFGLTVVWIFAVVFGIGRRPRQPTLKPVVDPPADATFAEPEALKRAGIIDER